LLATIIEIGQKKKMDDYIKIFILLQKSTVKKTTVLITEKIDFTIMKRI
jgi:hypothetical protein